VCVQVVKLLGSLVAVEPRLARKLLEPLATIVQNTSAKSLQFECIYTVTLALPFTPREDGSDAKNVPAVLNLCLHHLRVLVQDDDPNLKYLGLVGLLSLLRSHPRVVLEQRLLVLACLDDEDSTIRVKALELLVGVVTKKTLMDLVQQLLKVRMSLVVHELYYCAYLCVCVSVYCLSIVCLSIYLSVYLFGLHLNMLQCSPSC
jgi:AP-3 complex subunit delta